LQRTVVSSSSSPLLFPSPPDLNTRHALVERDAVEKGTAETLKARGHDSHSELSRIS